MLVKRRVVTGEREIDDIFDKAATAGVDLIEVCWSKLRPSIPKLSGYEVPAISGAGDVNFAVSFDANVRWVEGVTAFYPDMNDRCWGYIFDTPRNREKLENSLATGWFIVVDKKTREEIERAADANGKSAEHVDNTVSIKKTHREVEAERQAVNLQKKLDEYKKKMEEMEEKAKILLGEKASLTNDRVLKGVKISNREELMDKLKGDKENADQHSDYAA